MRVSELIEKLKGYDQDLEVLLSSDEEGNNFHDASDIEIYFVEREDTHYESILSQSEMTEQDEDDLENFFKRVLVIWP